MSTAPDHFTSSDGLRLAYRDEGEGLPLLCLAGLTRSMADFDYLAPHLLPPGGKGVRLIRMDYRGRGASQWAPDPASYSLEREARDALELLDHLGIERAAILGTSRGGLIAMLLAGTARHRLIGVCLNDVGPEIPPEAIARILGYLGKPPPFASRQEMANALPSLLPGFANVPPERWLEEARRQTRQMPAGLELTYDPRLREALLAGATGPTPDLWPLFDALEGLPLALIRGAGSDLLTADCAAQMHQRRPDMIFAEIPDRGHVPFLDEAESLAAIATWLKACRA